MKTFRTALMLAGALAVAVAITAGIFMAGHSEADSLAPVAAVKPPSAPAPKPKPPARDPAAEEAWVKIQPHLAAADKAAYAAVKKHCDRLGEFFAERNKRARPFAEKSLSFESKWEFAKSKLPLTDGDGHKKYLREQFEAIVLSKADLQEAIQSVVKEFVAELQGIENELLVKIRADIGDEALGALKGDARFATEAALHRQYERAAEKAAGVMAADLPVWGGCEAVTWIGADLTAPIINSLAASLVARLGLSGTILGGSAASGVATLGGALLAGIVLDAVLDRLLKEFGYDPESDVEKHVIKELGYCKELILHGEDFSDLMRAIGSRPTLFDTVQDAPAPAPVPAAKEKKYDKGGLYDHLESLVKERAKVRNAALKQLILEGGR